jgi:hypothetical protein
MGAMMLATLSREKLGLSFFKSQQSSFMGLFGFDLNKSLYLNVNEVKPTRSIPP